jgi:hypothetical protein
MLGDTAEKSKNPLKKAMRRRNAKTVTFNPPTYYEANGIDWSDAEAEVEGTGLVNGNAESRRNGGQLDRDRANGDGNNGQHGALEGQAAAAASVIANGVPSNGNTGRGMNRAILWLAYELIFYRCRRHEITKYRDSAHRLIPK